MLNVGNDEGAKCWIQYHGATKPGHYCVYRQVGQRSLPGSMCRASGRVLTFEAGSWGHNPSSSWTITAYHHKDYDHASTATTTALARCGFGEKVLDNHPPHWLSAPVHVAYPMWKRTSDEEGEDGSQAPSRAKKQALKKELPWKAMSQSEIPAFIKALEDEWSEWRKWSSCKPVFCDISKIDPNLVLKSRVCYRWKPKPGQTGAEAFKAKARIVVAGFKDPHLPLLSRDSPVLSRTGLMLVLQWACSNFVRLHNGDCKSAFLQGKEDTERPTSIFMRPPADPIAKQAVQEWNNDNLVYKLSAPVYGQANAPRRWYLHMLDVVTSLGWTRSSLDACLFLYKQDKKVVAVMGVHVDDVILAALPDYEFVLDGVHASFVWGSEWESKEFTFVGRRIRQCEDGSLLLDQENYVAEVPITKLKLDNDELLSNHPELITEFRSGIGSLQWLAGTTRGDIAADTSLLQKPPSELKVEDLAEVNAVLRYVRATNPAFVRLVPVPLDEFVFVTYGDSGWGNAPRGKSQGGLVVTATDRKVFSETRPASVLEWRSYRHQRVLRSTLAAEACSLDKAQDYAHYMAMLFSEMTDPEFIATMQERPRYEVVPVTDARSLWDAVHRLSTNFQEKRVEIDIAGLRETCRGFRWVPTEQQKADALTKRSKALRDAFREWMQQPTVTLVDSRSPTDVQLPGESNASWR